jgi:hypothetical protein
MVEQGFDGRVTIPDRLRPVDRLILISRIFGHDTTQLLLRVPLPPL